MQTSEVMIINRLDSGTTFATTVVDNQQVFVPGKIASMLNVKVGELYKAVLIENTARPDKTPWMAIRIDKIDKVQPDDDEVFCDTILSDLVESGMATVEDVAVATGYPLDRVVAKMQEMARGGRIKRRTFYAADEADFDRGDE